MDTYSERPTDSATTGLPNPAPRDESSTGRPHGETGFAKTPTKLGDVLKRLQTVNTGRSANANTTSPLPPATCSPKQLAEIEKWTRSLESSTPDHVMAELTKLAIVVRMPNDVDAAPMLRLYLEDLAEYPPDVLAEACRQWRRTEKFFPTIAELIALMRPRVAHRRDMLRLAHD